MDLRDELAALPDGYETRTAPLRPETVVWLFLNGQRIRDSDGHPLWFLDEAEAAGWVQKRNDQETAFREAMRDPRFARLISTDATPISRRSKRKETP